MPFRLALLIAVTCFSACQSTEDYLEDLSRLDPEPRIASLESTTLIFDEGQLSHEALTGLATADEMTVGQALISLSHGLKYLDKAGESPLLQADAAVLVGRLTTRIPVPPFDDELSIKENENTEALKSIEQLISAQEPLSMGASVEALAANDQVVREDALDDLRRRSDQDFGYDVDAWRAWWEGREETLREKYLQEIREPLANLGKIEFRNSSIANAIFAIVAGLPQISLDENFQAEVLPVALRIGRQAVVLSLVNAMDDTEHGIVRTDVANAMGLIRDPAFGEPLLKQLSRERDPHATAAMIRALAHYPSRRTIIGILSVMSFGDRLAGLAGAESLRHITGEYHGEDMEAWDAWWRDTGIVAWP